MINDIFEELITTDILYNFKYKGLDFHRQRIYCKATDSVEYKYYITLETPLGNWIKLFNMSFKSEEHAKSYIDYLQQTLNGENKL